MKNLRRRAALWALPALLLTPLACDDDDDPTAPTTPISFQTSFEDGAAGFVADGTDLSDPMVTWSVDRTEAFASDGDASMVLALDNVNDQAKIWMEREIVGLKPDTDYLVELSFDFGSSDWGDVNLWTLFADVTGISPTVWSDFSDAYVTTTANGASEASGVIFDQKTVSMAARTEQDGRLHVSIGIWGTYEVARSYYVDDVGITVTEVAETVF